MLRYIGAARAEHKQSTDAVQWRARNTADPQRPIHHLKALLEMRSKHAAMLIGSNMRPRNAVAKVAHACAPATIANASEHRVRMKFEQAGMSVCGQLLGYRVQQKVQSAGQALARQKICGRVQVLERGSRDGSHSEAHRIQQNAGRA